MYTYTRIRSITLPDQKQLNITIKANNTVQDLKEIVQKKSNIPIEQQNIIYQGKALLNDQSLHDYNIQNDSKLQLVELSEEASQTNHTTDETKQEDQEENKYDADDTEYETEAASDKLKQILRENNLYNSLYKMLMENEVTLDMLSIDMKSYSESQLNEFSADMGCNKVKQVHFKKLIRKIREKTKDNGAENNT